MARAALVLAVLVVVALAATDGSGRDEAPSDGSEPVRTTTVRPPAVEVAPPTTSATPPPPSAPATTVLPLDGSAGVRVSHVVDGDTIDLSDGRTVRLIGIDTPERGQCGYAEARDVLSNLVGGKVVALVPGARDDQDRYHRLLRYVEVDGIDVDLQMIRSGRAIARYDSRDGYGRHPREDAYVSADATTPSANVCSGSAAPAPPSTTAPAVTATVPPAGPGADPRFGSCREAKANGYGPYRNGVDPEYQWYRDGDGDGVNCE